MYEWTIHRALFNGDANLVFDDGIPEVVSKIAHGDHVSFLLRMFGGSGAFSQKLQIDLDPLESSETDLTQTGVRSGWGIRTRISFSVA